MENFNKAIIEFLNGRSYPQYPYAVYDENIKCGDLVVLHTGHHGLALGRIASLTIPASAEIENPVESGREVICKVDMTTYEERQLRAERIKELEAQLNKEIGKYAKISLFENMAEKHPEIKVLVDEYKQLINSPYGKENEDDSIRRNLAED